MFNGYLMRVPNSTYYFPEKYIVYGSFSVTPKQRQDKDPTRDLNGVLHRGVVPGMPSTIKFQTRDGLHLAQKQEIQAFFNACTTNAAERKIRIEFWDDESNEYRVENMYMPDMTFNVMWHTATDIVYSGMDFELIGYGD